MGNTTLRRVCLSLMAVDRAVNSTLANWKESQAALNELGDALAAGSKERPDVLSQSKVMEIIATARIMRNAKRDDRTAEYEECQRVLENHKEWIRAAVRVEDFAGSDEAPQAKQPEKAAAEPDTQLQRAILAALDGAAMTKDELAGTICGGEGSRLYKRGGIKELMEGGRVKNKRGVGYYRPDAPPEN